MSSQNALKFLQTKAFNRLAQVGGGLYNKTFCTPYPSCNYCCHRSVVLSQVSYLIIQVYLHLVYFKTLVISLRFEIHTYKCRNISQNNLTFLCKYVYKYVIGTRDCRFLMTAFLRKCIYYALNNFLVILQHIFNMQCIFA